MFFFCFCAVHLYLFVSNILHSNCHRKLISWQPKRQLFRTQITPIELCLGEHQLTFSCSQKYYKVSNVGWYSAKQSYTNDKQHASNYIFMVVYVHVVYEDPRMPQRRSWNWRPGTSWSSTPHQSRNCAQGQSNQSVYLPGGTGVGLQRWSHGWPPVHNSVPDEHFKFSWTDEINKKGIITGSILLHK